MKVTRAREEAERFAISLLILLERGYAVAFRKTNGNFHIRAVKDEKVIETERPSLLRVVEMGLKRAGSAKKAKGKSRK